MGIKDITMSINGYACAFYPGCNRYEVLQYSPFTGEELSCAFNWELQIMISDKLSESEEFHSLLEKWCEMLYRLRPSFDERLIPDNLKYLMQDKSWYYSQKQKERLEHKNGEFCGGLSVFVDTCHSYSPNIPKLASVPIQYCPFCGVKLPPEFNQENWWEKEFKTFKWYKDHKLGEWADDYVDDCDWDYPDLEQNT